MFAILCTDGQMSVNDVAKECVPGQWVPLLVYRHKGEQTPIIPMFEDALTARSFAKRNMKPPFGAVRLSDEDITNIKDKGWVTDLMEFPRKLKDRQDIELGLEIHEFFEQPDFRTSR